MYNKLYLMGEYIKRGIRFNYNNLYKKHHLKGGAFYLG